MLDTIMLIIIVFLPYIMLDIILKGEGAKDE